jgi:hypothetical protein
VIHVDAPPGQQLLDTHYRRFVEFEGDREPISSCKTSSSATMGPAAAEALASRLLSFLPVRLTHSSAAAGQARRVASTVPDGDRELLIAAAVLHDIGYSAPLIDTRVSSPRWNEPSDAHGWTGQVGGPGRTSLRSSSARTGRGRRGLACRVRQRGIRRSDALIYADMTASPDGRQVDVRARLTDIHAPAT